MCNGGVLSGEPADRVHDANTKREKVRKQASPEKWTSARDTKKIPKTRTLSSSTSTRLLLSVIYTIHLGWMDWMRHLQDCPRVCERQSASKPLAERAARESELAVRPRHPIFWRIVPHKLHAESAWMTLRMARRQSVDSGKSAQNLRTLRRS